MKMIQFKCGPEWDQRLITIRPKKRIGLLVSGGIDSTVLYHILKKHPKLVLYNLANNSGYASENHVRRAIGNPNLKINVIKENDLTDEPIGLDVLLGLAVDKIKSKKQVDELYTAANAVPPTREFKTLGDLPDRTWRFDTHPFMKGPFLPLYKFHIIELAIKFKVNFGDTHSCSRNKWGMCGHCFACEERYWAMKQFDISEIDGKIVRGVYPESKYIISRSRIKYAN